MKAGLSAGSTFLKHLPEFEIDVHSKLKSELYCCELKLSKCLQTRNNNILEWRDCKTLYKTSGKIPNLQHVCYIDLKLSPNIFQDNLKNYPEFATYLGVNEYNDKLLEQIVNKVMVQNEFK